MAHGCDFRSRLRVLGGGGQLPCPRWFPAGKSRVVPVSPERGGPNSLARAARPRSAAPVPGPHPHHRQRPRRIHCDPPSSCGLSRTTRRTPRPNPKDRHERGGHRFDNGSTGPAHGCLTGSRSLSYPAQGMASDSPSRCSARNLRGIIRRGSGSWTLRTDVPLPPTRGWHGRLTGSDTWTTTQTIVN